MAVNYRVGCKHPACRPDKWPCPGWFTRPIDPEHHKCAENQAEAKMLWDAMGKSMAERDLFEHDA